MLRKLYILILLSLFCQLSLKAQQETYTVTRASFSSDKYDEFSPVYYKNGIVFCSNRKSGSLADYSTSQGKGTFKINYIDTTGKVTWKKAKLFSKSLKTRLNDGPASFTRTGDTIYFSRNLKIDGRLGDLSNQGNKLGIFSAVLEEGKWKNIREFRFNSDYYNVTTPFVSSDGSKLFFSSDRPGGYGGSDIYVCLMKNGIWEDPVNLGPIINTMGNESYPYVNPAGELFFASDGHYGMEGKDIFFSRIKDNEWLPPVRLDPPLNSQYDDFGIITDTLINEGFFSSNRNKSIDILKFKTNIPQIYYTDIQKENQYCFRFSDSGAIEVDTLYLKYVWEFGDGKKASGEEVNHCFPGPGMYEVKLAIDDRATGKLFFSKLAYTLELKDFEQPYINSPDIIVIGEPVYFDGLKSFFPGYEAITYTWDFGAGTRMLGESVKYTFNESGEYNINLGVKLKSLSTGVIHNTGVTKKIVVLDNDQEKTAYFAKKASVKPNLPDLRKFNNAKIVTKYSAEEDIKKDALFKINLLSTKSRIDLNSSFFRNLPDKYSLIEVFEQENGLYSYIVSEQMNLMETYPSFKELYRLGFKDVQIKLDVIKDPVEKELLLLEKNYGILTDNYFGSYGSLKSSAYLILDQIVILMNRNPKIRLEVGVHTDNLGTSADNLRVSQTRAQAMVKYLINRGINGNRLVAKGYGGEMPVASNFFEKDRRLNRRVDFKLIK